jgi:uncharacterized membrane protein YfhO
MDVYTVSTGAEGGSLVLRIPYWPGLQATLGGRPIPVGAVDGALLRVTLPADADAEVLEIAYVPIGERLLVPATTGGTLLVIAATAGAAASGRRRDTVAAPVGAMDR